MKHFNTCDKIQVIETSMLLGIGKQQPLIASLVNKSAPISIC